MDIRQLRYFLQVYQDGSILQASQHIFISQQALSKAITSMEHEVGTPLFRRTSRGLIPTETGELLRGLAQPVIDAMDTLNEKISVSSKLSSMHLSVGISSGIEYFVRQQDLNTFCQQNPPVHVSIEEHSFDVCESLVENGSLTAAMISGPVQNSNLVIFHLLRRQRVALIWKDSPLAQRKLIRISDLKGYNFVLNINNRCFQTFCRLCRENGFEPVSHRVSDTSSMFSLCNEQGPEYVGISVDFLLLRIASSYPNLVALPIDFEEFSYPVDLIVNSAQYNRKIVRTLVDYIRKTALQINLDVPQYPYLFQPNP